MGYRINDLTITRPNFPSSVYNNRKGLSELTRSSRCRVIWFSFDFASPQHQPTVDPIRLLQTAKTIVHLKAQMSKDCVGFKQLN